MASVGFTITGAGEMKRRIQMVTDKFPAGLARAMKAEMEVEKQESMRRTPVRYGYLRDSHRVGEPEEHGIYTTVAITAGGVTAPYAVYVHENPFAIHPHGQWKFLESTLRESRPFMGQRIARRLEGELSGMAIMGSQGASVRFF